MPNFPTSAGPSAGTPNFALANPPAPSVAIAGPRVGDTITLHGRDLASVMGGSRRRRLWELSGEYHCSVIGVCIPIDRLRVLMEGVVGSQSGRDDYGVHCEAISECRQRSRLAEALQRELERRYAAPVRQAQGCKTTEALAQWWVDGCRSADVPGAYWAALTHSRCTPELQKKIVGEMHMLQHQAGVAQRVDVRRFGELAGHYERVSVEFDAFRKRAKEEVAERSAVIERQSNEAMRLRAALIARDTAIESLREEMATLASRIPELPARLELADALAAVRARNRELEAELASLRRWERAARQGSEAPPRSREPAATAPEPAPSPERALSLPDLRNQNVLCVGGRTGNVPVYRALIERAGADFQHHDGGIEDHASTLASVLAAADLVICQVGCISHGAYWRVKDHCKRTGKPCVFVDNPSASGLARGLTALVTSRSGASAE